MENRRNFLKSTGIAAGAVAFSGMVPGCSNLMEKNKNWKEMPLTLRFRPYELKLRHVFTLATSSRSTTPDILTELEWNGIIGYGEASLPPYLVENQESVSKFLSQLDLTRFTNPFLMEDIQDYVDNTIPANFAAKAAFDIALHDLVGKLIGQPWFKMWGLNPEKTPVTSFTIGIDTPEVVIQKVKEAEEFKILKVKLGRDTDKEMVETIRSITNVPICADANQGWTDRQKALDMCRWLAGKGVVFVEQPMPKTAKEDLAWLTQNSPLPIVGDEGVQTLEDVVPASHIYSGINIKLMKCGGLRAAYPGKSSQPESDDRLYDRNFLCSFCGSPVISIGGLGRS
jgi:L-alanine-DL-glutamate epimerase-like enolase superfamily enzyme